MIGKDFLQYESTMFEEMQKTDPGLRKIQNEIYEQLHIYLENLHPKDVALKFLILEYLEFKQISKRDVRCALLFDVIMELFTEALEINKLKILEIFSFHACDTIFYQNFWSDLQKMKSLNSADYRNYVREKFSIYEKISEGQLKRLMWYVVSCIEIIEKGTTNFPKTRSCSLGDLICIINETKYPGLNLITDTKMGLKINVIRNASAHSSIQTFDDGQIRLFYKQNDEYTTVQEGDLDMDIQTLHDMVHVIKFCIVLVGINNKELSKKYMPIDKKFEPESGYSLLILTFQKFSYTLYMPPKISGNIFTVYVKSIIEKTWIQILVELSLHLSPLKFYLEIINIQNPKLKIRIMAKNNLDKKIGYVEISYHVLNSIESNRISEKDLIKSIRFFNVEKKKMKSGFNKMALTLYNDEIRKLKNV